jgi:fibronectin-binding autotransporter adhesin
MKKILAVLAIFSVSLMGAYAQKLLDPTSGSGPLSIVTASSGGANTSVAVAYSVRQLKTTYDHPVAITPPTSVIGYTNSTSPLLRVRRSFDNAQLDIGYDVSGNLDTIAVKYFVSGKIGAAGPTNPTASGYVSVWYDQSGNSRDALQATTAQQPRIVNAGVLEVNGGGVPGIAGVSGGMIGHGGTAYDTEPAGVNIYGIDSNRTMNVVSQPRAWTNGTSGAGDGTYLIDRNGSTGIQDKPLTCLKAVNNNWSVQIRNLTNDISSSYEGAVAISLNRSDNVTLIRLGNTYPLYVNGVFAGTGTLAGENKMAPVRIGYGTNTSENVYYGEFLLFPSALSNPDLTALNNSQNVYFVLGPGAGTWTGLLSNSWATAGNWSDNTVPTLLSEITIPAGAINAPTITTTQSVKKLTISSGSTLTITGGNLNVSDTLTINGAVGGTGTITMNGSLKQVVKGTSLATIQNLIINNLTDTVVATTNLNINGTLTINSGAVFSALPSVVINNAAGAGTITGNGTVMVTRISATADYQSQYKFTTNTLTNLTVNYGGAGDQAINLGVNYGNLAVSGSGIKTISAAITATNVTGNISVLAATFNTNNLAIGSPTNRAVSISAGATMNAGTSIITFGTGTKTLTINGTFQTANTAGFTGSTATAIHSTNSPTFSIGVASTIEYNASAAQAVSARTDYGNVVLSGGSKTIATGAQTLAGSLTIGSGATYNGASNPTLSVGGDFTNNGTFTSGTGTVTFNGTGAQNINSTTTPLVFGGSVVFSGASSTATMGVNITAAADLNIAVGKILNLGTFTANRAAAGGGTLTVAGTLKLGANTGGQTGSNFPLNYTTNTFTTGGTVEYNGSNAITQTVFTATYANLILTNGSGTGTALKITTANISITTGNFFTINTGARYSPSGASLISGAGTLTGTGTIDVTGTNLAAQYTITNKTLTNLTINYAGGNQTVPGGTYSLLSVSGTGTKTMAGAIVVTGDVNIDNGNILTVSGSNFALSVGGSFTNNGTFTQGTGTVTLNGSGSQTIGGTSTTTFNNLTINKTTDTVFVNSNINVTGTLSMGSSVNAVLYPSATTVFNTAAGAGVLSGTGTILVTRIAATADLRNQYKFATYTFTSISVNYAGLGAQTVNLTGSPVINYSNLVISGSGVKTMDNPATATNMGNLTVNAGTFNTNNLAYVVGNTKTLTIAAVATFDAGSTSISPGTGFVATINGLFQTTNTAGFSGGTTQAFNSTNSPTITIGSASTIEYNTSAAQVVTNRTDYANLILSGGTKGMTTNTYTLSGSLTINSGSTYNGTTQNPTLNVAGNFTNNGTFIQGTNTVNFNGTGAQTIAGTTNPTAFSNSVIFSGTSSTATLATDITIGANLNINTGKTLDLVSNTCNRAATGGTLTVVGTLKLAGKTGGRPGSNYPNNFNTSTHSGTVEYYGPASDTQIVYAAPTYSTLILTNGSGTGTAVKTSTTSFAVNTGNFYIGLNVSFIPTAGNVISGGGTLTGFGSIDVNGTASLATQYTISNKTLTNLAINYTGTTQTIAAGTYTTLFVTGGGTKTLGGAVVITGDVGIESGSTLSVGGTNTLSVGGNWTNNGTYTQGTGTVTLNGLTAQSIGGTVATTFNNLTISNTSATVSVTTNTNVSGTLNMNGTTTNLSPAAGVVFNTAAAAGTLTGTGKVEVTRIATTADFRNQYKFLTYTLTSLTVEHSGAGTQVINVTGSPAINYSHIIISGSGTKSLDAALTATNATGNITINSGIFSTANFNITSPASRTITVATGATLNAGTSVILFGATTKVFNLYGTFITTNTNGFSGTTTTSISSTNPPTFNISSTSIIEYGALGTQTITFGTGANYGDLKISGSGTKSLASAVTTSNITGDILISAGTLSNNSGLAIAGNNNNTFTISSGASLELYGSSVFPTGFGTFVVDDNSTVNYAGGTQNVAGRQYGNLTISGTLTKTPAANITVNGDLTNGGGGFAGSTFTITLLGDWTNNATYTSNTSTVLMDGTLAQIISGSTAPSFNNLTIDNTAGVSMSAAVTTTGALSLTNGKLALGSNTLTISGAISTTTTNSLTANGSSNITFNSTGGNATFHLDQTTSGTTNRLGTLIINRSGSTITMSGDVQTAIALSLTGKLAIGSNTLVINGSLSSSGTNCFIANGSSNVSITGNGAGSPTLFLDQTTDGTTNNLGSLTFNRLPIEGVIAGNNVYVNNLVLTSGLLSIGLTSTVTLTGAITCSASNNIVGTPSAGCNLVLAGSGNATLFFSQINPGNTNAPSLVTINRPGYVVTMGNALVAQNGLTISGGKLAIGANTLTLNGTISTNDTNCIVSNGSSNITIGGSTGSPTFHLDQTTVGTTNRLGTLTINRSGQTITMGNDVQVATALTITGKLAIGSNRLTINGTISTTGTNCLVGSTASNLTFSGTAVNDTFNMDQTNATTRTLDSLIINRTASTILMNTTMNMTVRSALILTAGKLSIGANTLTLNGSVTSTTTNSITGSTSSNITFGGTASTSFSMDQTSAATRTIATLIVNRTGATVTMGNQLLVATALTLTNGKFAIGSNTLTIDGILTSTATNSIVGNGLAACILTFGSTAATSTLCMDQTTDGTTNELGTLTVNRTGQTVTLGSDLQTLTALTLTAGKFALGSNLLTINGTLTSTATNSLVANGSSDISFGGTGAVSLFLDQTTNGTTNRLGTLIVNRSSSTVTMGALSSMQIATDLTLTSGKLAIGANTLTIDGILTSSTANSIIGNGAATSILVFGGSAASSTLCLDQTTDGTTNEIGTVTINRGTNTVTLGSNMQVFTALNLTAGKLALGSFLLTINGTVANDATNLFIANGSSSISFTTAASGNASLFLDQTADGTTNRLASLTFNRTARTLTMGNSLQTATTLALTAGKVIIGTNTLTIDGTLTGHTATNLFIANGSSNLTFGGTGAVTLFLDQTTNGTTNRLGSLIVNRSSSVISMGTSMNMQIATALTLTSGKLAIGNNTLTIDGTVTSTVTNSITGSIASNISFGGSGNTTFHMDQNSATTRTVATLTVNRTGNVITMGGAMVSGTVLTLTNGDLAIGPNLLTINGTITSSTTNALVSDGSSNITFASTGGNATLNLDQTTPGTTNRLGTLIMNRTGNTLTMGTDVQTATALTLTAGKLAMGSNLLTVDGTITHDATNLLVANGSSNLTLGGTGAVTLFLDQNTPATTNRLGTFIVNRSSSVITMGASMNMQIATALTLTSGKLAIGTNTLTLDGAVTSTAANSITGSTTSNISFGGSGNTTFHMDQTGAATRTVATLTMNRTGNVITMGGAMVSGSALTLTNGSLAVGPNLLTINGTITSSTTNTLVGDGSSNITFASTGGNATLNLDQTTPGTTNRLGTLILDRTGNTLTMGTDVQTGTALTLTNGKLAIGSNLLTVDGTITHTTTNSLVANGSSNLTLGGTGAVTLFLDQVTPGTTNRLGSFIINRSSSVITMGASMNMQIATALTLTSGKLAIGTNTLTLDGTVTSTAANSITGSTTSNISFGGSGNTTFHMDQTSAATRTVATLTMNRTGNVITMGGAMVSGTALTLTNGSLAMGPNLLTINGTITSSTTNALVGDGSSNITFASTGGNATLNLDQTTPGTTNRLGTLILDRTGNTLAMGTAVQTATALTLTNGKLAVGTNTLTIDGAVTTTATNLITGSATSNISFGGSGNSTFHMDQTSAAARTVATLTMNRTGNVITMGGAMISGTTLTLTNGDLAIGPNLLTINGTITSSATNALVGDGSSNITFASTGGNATLNLDQTTPGTTNRLGTLILDRTGNTLTMGTDVQTATALTLTNGKLGIGSNLLTVDGAITHTATNLLVANGASNITFSTAAVSPTLFLDQTTPGTTNGLGTLTLNRSGQTLTMGNNLQTATALTLTNGKLIMGSNTLTINGAVTTSGTNALVANQSSNITFGGSGNSSFFLDQTTNGTSNRLGTLTIDRTSNTVTMGNAVQTATALTLTNGKLAIGANILTINGTLTSSGTNSLVANGSSSDITFGNTGNATLFLDQTTSGTTNRLGTLTLNRTGNTITMGTSLQTATALTLTAGKLAMGSNTLTINGTLTNSATNSLVSNGSSTITIGGTGALGNNVFLDQTILGTSNRLTALTYNRASQTITLGDTVEVTGAVTPTNGTLATGNKLKLISNASGDALISAGTGSYISGNVVVERFLPAKGSRKWRFMASPVTSSTLADWKKEIYITGPGGATNGFDSTASNQSGVYRYNEATITGNLNTGWVSAGNITDSLTPGKGFRIFVRGDRSPGTLDGSVTIQNAVTMNVVNPVNTGTINMLPTFTSSGVLANDGWNLMGNPYPSPIDWNTFHDAGRSGTLPNYSGTDYAHLDAVVYVYDPSGNGYTSYNAFSGAFVGSLTNGVIPSGAAFWVKASAGSPTMSMKEIYKTNTASTAAVFKTEDEQKQFTIKLLAATDEESYDETVIKYVNEATSGLDAYDISKMYGAEVNIASIGSDASFLSANYKPFNGKSDSIMLSIGIVKSGSYMLEFNDPSILVAGLPVYLVDLYTHQKVNITAGFSYPFTVDVNSAQTKGNERFAIVIGTEPVTTATPEVAKTGSDRMYLFPTVITSDISIITTAPVNGKVMISITDIGGKTSLVPMAKHWDNSRIELDLSEYSPGAYFVTVTEEGRLPVTLRCVKL